MTNEELKKKIVKVLKETINWTTDYSIPIGIVYKSELDNIADALIAAGLSFDTEWKHKAEVAEHNKNVYCRALYNLSLKYVVADNVMTIVCDDGNEYIAGQEVCALSVMANEVKKAEKELAEEKKE